MGGNFTFVPHCSAGSVQTGDFQLFGQWTMYELGCRISTDAKSKFGSTKSCGFVHSKRQLPPHER